MKKMICPKCGLAFLRTNGKLLAGFFVKLAAIIAPLGGQKCEVCFLKKVEERLLSLFIVWSN